MSEEKTQADDALKPGETQICQLMLPDGRMFLGKIAGMEERVLVLAEPAYVSSDGQGNARVQALTKPHANFEGPLRLSYPQNIAIHQLDPESDMARAYRTAHSGIHLPQGGISQGTPPGLRVLKGSH